MPESHNERGSFPSDFLREVPKNFGILHLLGMRIVKAQAGVGQVSIQVDGRLMGIVGSVELDTRECVLYAGFIHSFDRSDVIGTQE